MNTKTILAACAVLTAAAALAASPKNIILFIGDGMSTPQRMIADEFARKSGLKPLVMNRLPTQATTRTCSADSLVTDSAAAATAIACGEKTYNHALGVNAKDKPVESCAAVAHRLGKRVGIVTTVTINHATPGGFYAHRKSRGDGYGIGLDLLDSGYEFFAGGGLSGHNDKKHAEYRGDIYRLAADRGYRFIDRDRKAFDALKPGCGKVWFVGASDALPYAIDADSWGDTPPLSGITAKALELLDNEKGFFLMVEGGKVDYAGHANDAATNMRELIALDDAVRVALDWQAAHPDTLIVVTGDHETGGMTMGFADTGYALYVERLTNQKCSADAITRHLAREKPADFEALKPFLSEKFGFDFTTDDMKKSAMALTKDECKQLKKAFEHDLKLARSGKKDDEAYDARKITRLPTAVKAIFSHKCGIGWTSGSHTALPVLTTAGGPGAERFCGFIDNTDISKTLKALLRGE